LRQAGERFRFRRREVLWRSDEPADHLMLIGSGALKLVQPLMQGRPGILDLLARGDILGEESAIFGGHYHNDCVGVVAGHGWRVECIDLQRMARRDTALLWELLELAVTRAARFSERLCDFLDGEVEHRLARVLIRLGEEHGLIDARGTFVPLPLTRKELSEMVGCRSETAIRTMSRWTRSGWVQLQKEGIVLRDLAALKKLTNG
jgi:CRP/FNR family transcriptional regulator